MYPFGSLPENLVAFCAVLRREYGFGIGAGELHDAARALEIVDLTDQRAVRNALRPIFSRTYEEALVFDRAFAGFFFPGPPGAPQVEMPVRRKLERHAAEGERRPVPRSIRGGTDDDTHGEAGGPRVPFALSESEPQVPVGFVRGSYSPLEAEAAGPGPEIRPAETVWRNAARTFVRRLQLGLSRHWRPSARGRRFDMRRTLRASLQTGGEALEGRWLRRPKRVPRLVLLIDGSRSMDESTATALRVAVAIASVTMRLEVFTFSTSLRRVTDDVRRAAAGTTRRLEHLRQAWGGGTNIGSSLQEFIRGFGARSLCRDAVVIIASDGLDVGAPDVLREAMRELRRRSAGLVWLNPLLETSGYEPTAAGMAAARPFIGTLASLKDEAGLAQLARLVHVRR